MHHHKANDAAKETTGGRLGRGLRSRAACLAYAGASLLSGYAMGQATMLPPTPYSCFDQSPFAGNSLGYFYLETFEDHLFNTPGISADRGGVTSVVFGPAIHDSVDCDDGTLDGSGLQGDDFFSGNPDITFTFNGGVLGSLPTHVGLVWTDGGFNTQVTFEVFGPGGTLVGTQTAVIGDSSNSGTTAEDRFFGAIDDQGISAMRIRHTSGGLEVDHIQYGGGPSCDPDVNQDGNVDQGDVDYLINVVAGGDNPTNIDADFNRDGNVDQGDVDSLVNAVAGGGCA
ncbi:MAG: hypothetical protein WC718_14325 [Phycisphaerales bacterium]|jgi:hypothetical protein